MSFNLDCLKGKLIVPCQALPEEPLHSDYIMGRMAAVFFLFSAVYFVVQAIMKRTWDVELPHDSIFKTRVIDLK